MALSFGLSAVAAAEDAPKPIVITVAGPLTGLAAGNGEDMRAGAFAAARKLNAGGGVLGRPLEIAFEDDACSPTQAVSVANRIVGTGSHYVIGHYCSAATIPASQVYEEAGIVSITLSQADKITQQNFTHIFRMTPSIDAMGKEGAKALITHDNQRIALIGNNGEYATNAVSSIEKNLADRSIKPVMQDFFPPQETDFSAIITKMKGQHIDTVFMAGDEREMALFVRQAADQAFKPAITLSSTAASANFPILVQCAGENVKVVAAWNPLYFPGHEALLQTLRESGANGVDTAINTYAAVEAYAQALQAAGKDDPEAVAGALHTQILHLASGETQFTQTGDQLHPETITYVFQGTNCPGGRIDMRPLTP